MKKIFSLCNDARCCPLVIIDEDVVTIGEENNRCTLTRAQWNVLVKKIKKGELD